MKPTLPYAAVRRSLQRLGYLDGDGRITELLRRAAGERLNEELRSPEFRRRLVAVYGPALVNHCGSYDYAGMEEAFSLVPEIYRHKVKRFFVLLAERCGLRVRQDVLRSLYKNSDDRPVTKRRPANRELRVPGRAEREWVFRTFHLLGGRVAQIVIIGEGELTNSEWHFLGSLPDSGASPGASRRRTIS